MFLYTMRERSLVLIALCVLMLFVSPLFILGENAHIRIHDNLDSNIAWYKVLKESGQMFGPLTAVIPQIMNGLSRNAFATEFSGIVWLHHLFPTMVAYSLSQTITRVFAFFGMYWLLRDHVLVEKEWAVIRVGTALTFALTPFWPSGMLSTLGMPLALWAFMNIRKGVRTCSSWAVFTLLPLYSSLVLGFFFFLFAMGMLWFVDLLKRGKNTFRFLLAIVYMSIVYALVEYRLFYSFLFSREPNSRDEYFHAKLSFVHSVRLTLKNYLFGHTHVMTIHTLIILPLTLLALYIVIKTGWKKEKSFVYLFILNMVLSVWYAFWFYRGWQPLTERFHFLDTFNFARFHFLRPLVIYMLFGLALKILWQSSKRFQSWVPLLLTAQLIVLCFFNEEVRYHKQPSVKEFYAEKLFTEVKQYIGAPTESYRVASIGIHPAIAQYNGLFTIDSYNNFYFLSYKHDFRKIISQELEKNKKIRHYFDEWGGRCYLFTDELSKQYVFRKNAKKKLYDLQLNTEPFKRLGGRYIISAVQIVNSADNQLELERVFTSKESAWKVYLYKVL